VSTPSIELGPTDLAPTLSPGSAPGGSSIDGDTRPGGRGAALATLTGGRRLGRYTLLEQLGRGGMGVVFTAYDEELDRKVAIKFLLHAHADDRAVLLSEAQAMARLAHPNVIHVYEVGEGFERHVYIAMEFVRGQSLRAWSQTTRPWPEVLAMFMQAGRGLAAAHQAGVVHCDFKPDNVLIGHDGRARVLDFGLARRQEAPSADDADSPGSASTHPQPFLRGGTPAYMPPEQLDDRVDERSDQFSFCVALFEALTGQRPFAGTDVHAILAQVCAGAVISTVGEARLPARLRRAIRRGLSAEPADRHPSMAALLAELAESLPRPRGAWIGAAVASALVATIASWLLLRAEDPVETCAATVAAEIDPVWSEAPRAAVEHAFAATGLPYAAGSFARTARLLDAHTAEWSRLRQSACELAHSAPSAGTADRLRARCLERRRLAIAAWVDTLTRADATLVERAVAATAELPAVQPCADPTTLLGEQDDDGDREHHAEIQRIERLLAEARAHALAGQHARGLTPAETAHWRARQLGHPGLVADALLQIGLLQESTTDGEHAGQTLKAAYYAAEAARRPAARAEAAVHLVYVTGAQAPRQAEGEMWARQAEAIAEGLGEAGLDLRAELLEHRSRVAIRRRQYGEARRDLEAALALTTVRLGAEHPALAGLFEELGEVALFEERYDEALEFHQRALDMATASLGPDHPTTARRQIGRGKVHERRGRFAAALRDYQAALALWEGAYGPDNTRIVWALTCIGRVLVKSGDLASAEPHYARAAAVLERALGPEHLELAKALVELGIVVRARGRTGEARDMFERAADIFVAEVGERHPLALALIELGEGALADGDVPRAIAALERTRRVQGKATNTPDELARTDFALARALWAAGEDPPRALSLAASAAAAYRDAGAAYEPARRTVDAWLAAASP